MHLDRYSKLQVTGVELEELAAQIALWTIPADGRDRARRGTLGMPRTWTAEQLRDDADLAGEAELRVQARWSTSRDGFVCRFVHRDSALATIFWHIVFRVVREDDGGCSVECGVARSAPRGLLLPPHAYPPRVFVDLLQEPGAVRVRERALTLPVLNLRTVEDAHAFLDELLFRADRETPVVVVACDVDGGDAAHVDIDVLAKKLHGLAVVAALVGSLPATAYRTHLVQRAAPSELACFNGGIHTYGPTRVMHADHRLWLGRNLAALPGSDRSERVGEALAQRLALAHLPVGFFQLIEESDRRARAERTSAPTLPAASADDVAAATSLMEEANARAAAKDREVSSALERIQALESEVQRLQIDLGIAEQQSENLQQVVERYKAQRQGGLLAEELRDAMQKAIASQDPSPSEALLVIEALFPERVVVLAEARESAREARAYLNPRDVYSLLVRLATQYWERMSTNPGEAHRTFTQKEFAADGSKRERNDRKCVEDRTRNYRGRDLVMWKHLKAGGNGGPDRCLRIHFEWVADERRIVIGHCGSHLREAT